MEPTVRRNSSVSLISSAKAAEIFVARCQGKGGFRKTAFSLE
jgi:hypothetical protein